MTSLNIHNLPPPPPQQSLNSLASSPTAYSPTAYSNTEYSPISPISVNKNFPPIEPLGVSDSQASSSRVGILDSSTLPEGSDPLTETTSTKNEVPDGGWKAWMQVLGVWCIYFNTWGILSSFGAFQAYYKSSLLQQNTAFEISIIGSLQSFLTVFLGFIAGPIYDLGFSKQLLWGGSTLIVVGTVTQSLSIELWHFILSESVCIGLGAGCLSVLSVAIPTLWFSKRLPLANGIAASGSGVGGLVLPALFRAVQPHVGFRYTVLIIALINILTLGITVIVLDTPTVPRQRRAFIDKSAFTDVPYLMFLFGCFMVFLGMYTPFTYIQSFALDFRLTDSKLGLYLLSILNGASILGRIVPNFFTNSIGPINLQIMTTLLLCLAALILMAVHNLAGLLIVIIIYGFASGTFFALQPTIFTRLVKNKKFLGTRFGMAFSVMSFALLFGPPISGALIRSTGYHAAWAWTGAVIACGAALIWCARITHWGLRLGKV